MRPIANLIKPSWVLVKGDMTHLGGVEGGDAVARHWEGFAGRQDMMMDDVVAVRCDVTSSWNHMSMMTILHVIHVQGGGIRLSQHCGTYMVTYHFLHHRVRHHLVRHHLVTGTTNEGRLMTIGET